MSEINVKVQIFKTDVLGPEFNCPGTAPTRYLPGTLKIVAEEFLIPFATSNSPVVDYRSYPTNALSASDAIQTVHLFDPKDRRHYWILGNQVDWQSRADACCGNSPAMPSITPPSPAIDYSPCGVQSLTAAPTAKEYDDAYPYVTPPAGQVFTFTTYRANGVNMTPAPATAGYVSQAAVLTWVQANWGAYGTWSHVIDNQGVIKGLKLVSTTGSTTYVMSGGFVIGIKAAP